MIVKTKLSEHAEQFEIDGVHYVGRRVLCAGLDISRKCLVDVNKQTVSVGMILFRLDYDRGLIFVEPSLLRPYQRPERKESEVQS